MNKILLAAFLLAASTSVFGQTKEEIESSKERIAKIQKLETPKDTSIQSIDDLQVKIGSTALESVAITPLLQNFYYRSIGQSADGITDVTIKKPTLAEVTELSLRIYAQKNNLEQITSALATASQDASATKNPLKLSKALSAVNYAKNAVALLGEETVFQVNAIQSMIQTLSTSGNL